MTPTLDRNFDALLWYPMLAFLPVSVWWPLLHSQSLRRMFNVISEHLICDTFNLDENPNPPGFQNTMCAPLAGGSRTDSAFGSKSPSQRDQIIRINTHR